MKLLNFLKTHNISQSSLAKTLGVTPSTVNLWVNNKCFPSYDMCKKLLEMGMYVDDLFEINYKDMHAHDSNRTYAEIEAKSKSFKDAFDECMKAWIEKNGKTSL